MPRPLGLLLPVLLAPLALALSAHAQPMASSARPAAAPSAPSPSAGRPAPSALPGADADAPYYLTRDDVQLYRTADSLRPVTLLPLRTSVYRLAPPARGWTRVRTESGLEGFLYAAPLSNVWVRVSKSRRMLYLYRGADLVKTYPADFGYNPLADKEQRGSTTERDHWRTPEGTFYVARRNAASQFHRAFVLSYPNAEHAARALRRGQISQREHDAIAEAERTFAMPPMNTALGGMIEIHGRGTGAGVNWTQGCVALRDAHVDELWPQLSVGTPVVIEP